MAKPIVARWEWRTFGAGFDEPEARIRNFEQGNFKESGEVYVLSRNSDENVKVRDDLLDIKSLQEVNADGLEQWFPVLKAGFPISVEAYSVSWSMIFVYSRVFNAFSFMLW